MQIISKETIVNESYLSGNIVVCFMKEDAEAVKKEIIVPLERRGYRCILLEQTAEACQEFHYLNSVKEKIIKAQCGIIVLSEALMNENNNSCLQSIFYEYGIMESKDISVFPYILNLTPEHCEELFQGKPFSYIQGAQQIERIFAGVDALKLSKEDYFDDYELNQLVLERIKYVRITSTINIKRETLLQIWSDNENGWEEQEADFNHENMLYMINKLCEELRVGALVVRFGKDATLSQDCFSPYIEESKRILYDSPAKYEKIITPKWIEQSAKFDVSGPNDIVTTMKLEFLVPVHDILGTSYIPYISAKKTSRWKPVHLLKVIKDSYPSAEDSKAVDLAEAKTMKAEKENILYFLLPAPTTNMEVDLSDTYGRKCNFIYPQ